MTASAPAQRTACSIPIARAGRCAEQVLMPSFKRIVRSSAFQGAVGAVGAWYLRLVWHTSSKTYEPATIYDTAQIPAILAMWHGQHFLMPFIKKDPESHRAKVLISRHRDLSLIHI